MIKLMKNRELLRPLAIYAVISAVGVAAAFILFGMWAGSFTLALCGVFIFIFLQNSLKRYQLISRLSHGLNRILHGEEKLMPEQYEEGELSLLQSEIYKMTVTLREQSQKLQEDKVFLANSIADISHQIRTPLTSMNITLSLLSEQDISEERRAELTRELFRLLSRIDRLINTLLKLSRLDAGAVEFKREDIPFNELISSAVEPILAAMELKGQSLEIKTEGSFQGDMAWTCEAVGNIVKNCCEHTAEGGRITITASENPLYSEIIISDNGSGIDSEDLPNIFKRFYKGKSSAADSFGIGLALAKMIVSEQNGTIKAENSVQSGAVFTIRFYKGAV